MESGPEPLRGGTGSGDASTGHVVVMVEGLPARRPLGEAVTFRSKQRVRKLWERAWRPSAEPVPPTSPQQSVSLPW